MKRVWIGLLILALLLGSGSGFAESEPMEAEADPIEIELDKRVSVFIEADGAFFGDVKYLANGNVAVQGFAGSMMELSEVDRDGKVVDNHIMYFDVLDQMHRGSRMISNFIVEDIDGNLYTGASGGVAEITYDFSTSAITQFPEFWDGNMWCNVQSKGRAMSNTINGFGLWEFAPGGAVLGLTYEEGQSPADLQVIDYIAGVDIEMMTELGYEDARLISADFGETENELYLLYGLASMGSAKIDRSKWAIIEMNVEWIDGNIKSKQESFDESDNWTVQNIIELDETFDNSFVTNLIYDGTGFQIAAFEPSNNTVIYRVNKEGKVKDSVKLPGESFYFDAKGNETIASVMIFGGTYLTSGYYKIEWGTSSVGSPSRLIRERTIGGKTTAVFRDGGYGLLQKNEDESGAIDYLAPLRTKENDVRLRMPLSDVLTRLGGSARNLEILFGEDRILIPMTALAVQDLLAEMPCETDATIEIHLVRAEDGKITVTADLFVVEQVDGMTRLVHRRAIDLP